MPQGRHAQAGVGWLVRLVAWVGQAKPSRKLGVCGEHGGDPEHCAGRVDTSVAHHQVIRRLDAVSHGEGPDSWGRNLESQVRLAAGLIGPPLAGGRASWGTALRGSRPARLPEPQPSPPLTVPVPPGWLLPVDGVVWRMLPPPRLVLPPPPPLASDVPPLPTLPPPVTAGPPLLDWLGPPPLPAVGAGAMWLGTETVVRIAAGAVTRGRADARCRTACLVAR